MNNLIYGFIRMALDRLTKYSNKGTFNSFNQRIIGKQPTYN